MFISILFPNLALTHKLMITRNINKSPTIRPSEAKNVLISISSEEINSSK